MYGVEGNGEESLGARGLAETQQHDYDRHLMPRTDATHSRIGTTSLLSGARRPAIQAKIEITRALRRTVQKMDLKGLGFRSLGFRLGLGFRASGSGPKAHKLVDRKLSGRMTTAAVPVLMTLSSLPTSPCFARNSPARNLGAQGISF